MGHVIKNNIFRDNEAQRYFKRFPVQVAVLFSPSDQEFSAHFRDLFLHLDQVTGKDLVFFAVLNPPEDWLKVAQNRGWWREYEQKFGRSPFTIEDKVLVYDLARLFNVNWGSLPVLVIGTNLWTSEFITVPTDSLFIEQQLTTLTTLVREWGQPNIDQIAVALEDALGLPSTYDPASQSKLQKFDHFYEALGSIGEPSNTRWIASRALDAVNRSLRQIRQAVGVAPNEPQEVHPLLEPAANHIVAELTGNLVASFSALRYVQDVYRSPLSQFKAESVGIENLEEESEANIATALLMQQIMPKLGYDGGIRPYRGNFRKNRQSTRLDYTPMIQGLWKALELEANLSVIQAARKARTVKMPELFALYDHTLEPEQGKVKTDNGRKKDINQKVKDTSKHRFLPLGDAWYVIKAMNDSPKELFQDVIKQCLTCPLPSDVLGNWFKVIQPRNTGSHVDPIALSDTEEIREHVLDSGILRTLVYIKTHLRGH